MLLAQMMFIQMLHCDIETVVIIIKERHLALHSPNIAMESQVSIIYISKYFFWTSTDLKPF